MTYLQKERKGLRPGIHSHILLYHKSLKAEETKQRSMLLQVYQKIKDFKVSLPSQTQNTSINICILRINKIFVLGHTISVTF